MMIAYCVLRTAYSVLETLKTKIFSVRSSSTRPNPSCPLGGGGGVFSYREQWSGQIIPLALPSTDVRAQIPARQAQRAPEGSLRCPGFKRFYGCFWVIEAQPATGFPTVKTTYGCSTVVLIGITCPAITVGTVILRALVKGSVRGHLAAKPNSGASISILNYQIKNNRNYLGTFRWHPCPAMTVATGHINVITGS